MNTTDTNTMALEDVDRDLDAAIKALAQAQAELATFRDALRTQIEPDSIGRGARRSLLANATRKAQSVSHNVHRTTDSLLDVVQHMAALEATD